jgi:hypothetical protein
MKHAIPDVATARRCIDALCDYLATKDDSPRAAADLRESIRLLSAQPSWQPMSTAPKDARNILLTDGWNVGQGYLVGEKRVVRWANEAHRLGCRPEPTHWQPLPSPPPSEEP